MSRDPRDYKLDLSSAPAPDRTAPAGGRPYVSVRFDCCRVYTRIYRDRDGRRYSGRCPRCGRPVNFLVGEGGTTARFFIAR